RMLLYAASELYNNPSWAAGYAHPELISVTGDRTAKWQAAKDAAKAVIDMGIYSCKTREILPKTIQIYFF
ncbi:MAG TPA: RagB/SusD family nutrient uptake outer membrane protein, partial [Chryseolinea sp.]|nr:RagB/SusD family nutrient uptake outer membrane protein [Chryseolinea sp.]